MCKLLLTAFLLTALFSASGCHNSHDRNDDTGKGEKQDRIDVTTGKMPDSGR